MDERWRPHLYPVVIEQILDAACLATPSDTVANEADESGYLAGKQMYQDLRGYGWPDVARALSVERRLIARLQEAADLEAEGMQVDDERLDCFEPSDSVWGLDLGVASATIALSAFGAIPVGSCNAGGFGGFHQSAYPLCRLLRWRSGPQLDRLDGADGTCRTAKRRHRLSAALGRRRPRRALLRGNLVKVLQSA
jgi:hypothetical protein